MNKALSRTAVPFFFALALAAQCQTTLLFEGFEGIFPTANGWATNDTTAPVYWKDVAPPIGTVTNAHTGSWIGYCAGWSNGAVNLSGKYSVNMTSTMSKSINFSGYTGANLNFWYDVPSIEFFYDHFRVYMDATLLFDTDLPTTGWANFTAPLNPYLGGSHTLKFEFDSDSSVTYEGAYLDDILVDAANQPFTQTMQALQITNYYSYLLDNDATGLGLSNIAAQTTLKIENFTGTNTIYTNVLSYRLINATTGAPHPIYDFGDTFTNSAYTYNITNVVPLQAGTNVTFSNVAYIKPALRLSQFTNYYVECRMLTNGVLAQTLTTASLTYYHFTNTVSGDAAYNVLLDLLDASWSRTYAVQSIPGQNTFQVGVDYDEFRYDGYNGPQTLDSIPIVFNFTLRDASGNAIPLVSNSETFYDLMNNWENFGFPGPYAAGMSQVLDIQPSSQLDSVNKTYYLTVTIAVTNNPVTGQVVTANTQQTTTNELLAFDGNLYFGTIGTTINSLGLAPPANAPSGGVIPTSLSSVGGYVTAKSDHAFTTPGPLGVSLEVNGDAIVTAGTLVLTGPVPDIDTESGISFQRGAVTLYPGGATANLTLFLPTGLGYRLDTNSMVIQSTVQFSSVALNPSLDPASNLNYAPGTTVYAAEECKPVWILSDRIFWNVTAGLLSLPPIGPGAQYVRAGEYNYLAFVSNNLVDPPNMGDKRSNDKYWLFLTSAPNTLTVRSDNSGNALLTGNFKYGPGQFRAHFPYDTVIQWTGVGSMTVTDDLVPAGTGSQLSGAANVSVPYTRDCADCSGGGMVPPATPTIIVSNGIFNFTTDGGLAAMGATTASVTLQWGYNGAPVNDYAQQALSFSNGGFHMPGVFLRGDQNALPAVQRPTTILYTGVNAYDESFYERPLSSAYSKGFADYAGLNFRCVADGVHGARSTIASAPNINWLLDARSKYYVRYGGVTGIHEAVPGSFPSTLTLWGYKFTFSSYGLSYRDSQQIDSVTDGAVSVPYPAGFIENFSDMEFSCLGAPKSADIDPNDPFKVMVYWLADFRVHSMTFSQKSCGSTTGFLVLGIEAYASHIPTAMYGEVGFFPAGDQIPASYGLPGVTSRLKSPNTVTIDGPTNSSYTFTPIQDAYYNTWSNSPSGGAPGWISLFGKVNVPFFEDLQVEFQTSCHTNGVTASNALIYLSGGWPRAGTTNNNYGWLDSLSRTPFEINLFDSNNAGWPGSGGGLTIANYRDDANNQMWHPRAQRVWLNVVNFDYPLSWNYSLRSFKSWQPVTNDLLVITVQHSIKYMDPRNAEVDFGAQYSGLPTISIANLAFNAIDQGLGVSDAITKAASKPIEDVLSSGLDKMDQLLDSQMKSMMDGVFDHTVDPVIDNFYNQLHTEFESLSPSAKLAFAANVSTEVSNFFNGNGPGGVITNLNFVFTQLGNVTGQSSNIIGQIRTYLHDATNAIDSVVSVVGVATNGQGLGSNVVGLIGKAGGSRPILPGLLGSLVGDIAPQFIDAVIGPSVSNALSDLDPALDEISTGLVEVRSNIVQVDNVLSNGAEFASEINNTITTYGNELSNVTATVSGDVNQYFTQFNYQVDDPFVHVSPADLKLFIRQKVEDYFFSTDVASQIQTALRQRLYDVNAALQAQIDSVFQELNGAIRDLIGQSLSSLDNTLNQCLGDVGGSIGSAKLNGHALIHDDDLSELRIDGHFEFKVPDDMDLDAFLEIKTLNSDGSASGCVSAHAPWTEVTIGATGISLDWAGCDATADVEAKFTFDGTVPFPVNLGGQVTVNGELDFEAFQLHDLAAAMAFGKYENYIALKGGVKFSGYDFSGAIFFGKTCTIDPLKLIDPDVASVLGDPPFTGAYVYAQGWIPISEDLTGVPATCLFEISAGIGAGAFYFAEGPTYGGKMFLGVSGSLLCIVSIEGDVTLIGLKHGDDMRFKGHGHFEAELGPCPFCLKISKDVDITYEHGWSVDF